jgi:hypothetical protein
MNILTKSDLDKVESNPVYYDKHIKKLVKYINQRLLSAKKRCEDKVDISFIQMRRNMITLREISRDKAEEVIEMVINEYKERGGYTILETGTNVFAVYSFYLNIKQV